MTPLESRAIIRGVDAQHDDSQNDTQKRATIPGRNGGTLIPFQKGYHGGSAPKGKRISTWMAEFGDMEPSKWPSAKRLEKMPANASIALARLRKARMADGIRDTELILDRTEGAVVAEPAAPMIQSIAAAILALKAAGVELRRPAPVPRDVTPPTPMMAVDAEDDAPEFKPRRDDRGRS